MLFRRRNRRSPVDHIRNAIWPAIGWRRTVVYLGHRLARLKGSPHSIAAGFAYGAAVSFTPFVGLHLVASAFLAWITRGNILAAWIGTLVGNPWTFPIIWVWIYQLGRLMGFGEHPNGDSPNFTALFGNMVKSMLQADFQYLQDSAWPIFGAMLIGSIPTAIVAWIVSYYIVRGLLGWYQAARAARRKKILAARRDRQAHQTENTA